MVHTNKPDVSDSAAEPLLQHHWGEVLAEYKLSYLCQYTDSAPLLIKSSTAVSSAYIMMWFELDWHHMCHVSVFFWWSNTSSVQVCC